MLYLKIKSSFKWILFVLFIGNVQFVYSQVAEKYYNLGLKEIEKENYSDKAKEYFRLAIKEDSTFAKAYNQLGFYSFLYEDNYDLSLYYYNKAISVDSNCSDVYFNIGSFYLSLGKLDSAEFFYKKYTLRDTCNFNGFFMLAQVQSNLKKYDKALINWNKTIKEYRLNAESYRSRGWAKFHLKDSIGAMLDFDTAISIRQESNYFLSKGLVYMWYSKYDSAIISFNKAHLITNMNWENTEIQLFRGICKYYLKNYIEALVDIENAIKYGNPKWDIEKFFYRGVIYYLQNEKDKACLDFEMAIKMGLDINNTKYQLIKTYYLN